MVGKTAQRGRRIANTGVSAMLAVLLFAPEVAAQAVTVTTTRTPTRRPMGMQNVCVELSSSPSPLVNAPEGLALLRLKRELESAALTLEQHRQLEREQVQRISQVQRGVDSAMQVVVRFWREDNGEGNMVIRRLDGRADSMRVVMKDMSDTRKMFFPVDSTLRVTMPQIGMFIRSLQPQVAAFASEAEARLPAPASSSGYVGLSLSGAQIRMVTPEGVMTSHCDYPLVETVDVGSPAARAGLNAGDTLLAYNGRDVTQQAINYPEMLSPGSMLRVRVRRSGRTRDIPVTVAPRKEERTLVFTRTPLAPGAAGAPVAPPISLFSGSGVAVIAGAQFATIDAEFAESQGLEPGVLVLRVPQGTPAADAGLRAGEVVRSVNGVAVRDVASLRRIMNAARDVKLVVQSRAAGVRTVMLELR